MNKNSIAVEENFIVEEQNDSPTKKPLLNNTDMSNDDLNKEFFGAGQS